MQAPAPPAASTVPATARPPRPLRQAANRARCAADKAAASPSPECAPSSRRCAFHPESRPTRIAATSIVWVSITTGAINPAISVSNRMPARQPQRAAEAAPLLAMQQDRDAAQQLRHQQQCHGADEHPHGAHRIDHRPLRKQRLALREIIRRHKARLHRDQDAGQDEQQPQRRGDVRSRSPVSRCSRLIQRRPRVGSTAAAADCPGTIADRAPPDRSASAAPPRSCRARLAPCAPPSRRAASAPPRRSRGS